MADLKVALMLVFGFVVLPEELRDLFIGLLVLALQFLQPLLGLLHVYLFDHAA